MNEKDWNNWLDRLLDGDPEAFEVIYGKTKNKVYGTVAMLVSNKQDVDDIVSEIYIQLWKALPNYDRSRPFLFWMNGIVLNQVNNWRRQIWRRFRLSKRSGSLHEEVSPEIPDEFLAIPVGTVKSRNHKPIQQMRQRFGNHLKREVYNPNV